MMMKIVLKERRAWLLLNIFIFYLLTGCSFHSDFSRQIIEVDLSKCKNASINYLFSAIRLIQLETTNQSLIKEISKIEYFENQYYILDRALSNIIVFDENGRHKYAINHRGNGPGEYVNISDFIINENRRSLELLSSVNSTVYIWNIDDGSYWKEIKLPFLKNGTYKSFMIHPLGFWIFWTFDYKNRIKYIDYESNEIIHECFDENSGDIFCPYEFSVKNKLCRSLNPCVYKFDKSGVEIDYKWNIRGLENNANYEEIDLFQSKTQMLDYAKSVFKSEIVDYVIIKQGESPVYRYMQIIRKNERYNVFQKKATKEIVIFQNTEEDIIINPYYWGESFMISAESEDVNTDSMVNVDLLDDYNKNIWNSKKVDDNPVLVKYIY